MVEARETFGVPSTRFEFDGGREAHVWWISLDKRPAELSVFGEFLSKPERHRADRFRFSKLRDRFVAGRGALRLILSWYLRTEPSELRFETGPAGKPALSNEVGGLDLRFNLSHSEDAAVLVVADGSDAGIDLERTRPIEDCQELVKRFFSPREAALFSQLPAAELERAFLNLWTRKEALLKATGEGIAHSLNRVEVSFLKNEPARLLSVPGEFGSADAWTLEDIKAFSGYCVAVAIRRADVVIRLRRLAGLNAPHALFSKPPVEPDFQLKQP